MIFRYSFKKLQWLKKVIRHKNDLIPQKELHNLSEIKKNIQLLVI